MFGRSRPEQRLSERQQRLARRIIGAGFAFIIALILVSHSLGRWSSAARRIGELLVTSTAADYRRVVIEPYPVVSLVERELVLEDPADIAAVLEALRSARRFSPVHPDSGWVAVLRLVHREMDFGGQVSSTTNGQGVLLYLASEVRGGWHYGSYRVDALGPVLERLARRGGAGAGADWSERPTASPGREQDAGHARPPVDPP